MNTFGEFVNDRLDDTVALLPGGFKPPTKGHYNAFKHLLSGASEGIIYIGKKERDGITAEQSKKIWEVYAKTLDKPVRVEICQITPVKSVYDYADANPNRPVTVGAGAKDEDIKRYEYFEKNRQKYPFVEVVKIPIQSEGISGTLTRKLIGDDIQGAIDYFVPEEVQGNDRELIKLILLGNR